MAFLGAFIVPHPPIILPEIGKDEVRNIEATTKAYDKVAKEIAALAPDTVIISSPHSILYSDYFHISPGSSATGDMRRFGVPQLNMKVDYDTELVTAICNLSDEDFAGTLGERDPSLDHGTFIPLYFIRKYYTDFKVVRIGLSGYSLAAHYEMGQIIRRAVEKTGRRAVYVASGDLSHKMKADGPYGFAPEGPRYDEEVMKVCAEADFGKLFDFSDDFCDKAAECGHRSFVMMAGALDGLSVQGELLSHEAPFGVGYGICRYTIGGEDMSRCFLEKRRKNRLSEINNRCCDTEPYVRLARFSLESFISCGKRITREDLTGNKWSDMPGELFSQKAGAFISIHKDGALRGCIGTILPTRSCVADEIMHNAISAAVNDPRFPSITEDELDKLDISVDVLGDPEPISGPEELDVKRYGVIVTSGRKRGLLLPDLDGVDTVEEQIDIACRKAGIYDDETYSLERFEVIRHH